jgi:hypothetical protein
MKRLRDAVAVISLILIAGFGSAALAQEPHRHTEKEVKRMLERIEKDAERFRNSLARALDVSSFDDSKAEDDINQYIKEFEAATDRLEDRFDNDRSAASDVENVLERAARIDRFMIAHRLSPSAQEHWAMLRVGLDELARAYNVSWSWAGVSDRPRRLTDDQMKGLLARIEASADRFRKSLADALDKTDFDDTNAEDDINRYVREFESATDRMKGRFDDDEAATGAVREVLTRAARIDVFINQHRLTDRAREDWMSLRRDLDELAVSYGVSWRWA